MPHNNNMAKIIFDEPQISVTPGQSAVFYMDEIVLGGGIIEMALDKQRIKEGKSNRL